VWVVSAANHAYIYLLTLYLYLKLSLKKKKKMKRAGTSVGHHGGHRGGQNFRHYVAILLFFSTSFSLSHQESYAY